MGEGFWLHDKEIFVARRCPGHLVVSTPKAPGTPFRHPLASPIPSSPPAPSHRHIASQWHNSLPLTPPRALVSGWSGATPERTSPKGLGRASTRSTRVPSPNRFSSCVKGWGSSSASHAGHARPEPCIIAGSERRHGFSRCRPQSPAPLPPTPAHPVSCVKSCRPRTDDAKSLPGILSRRESGALEQGPETPRCMAQRSGLGNGHRTACMNPLRTGLATGLLRQAQYAMSLEGP